MVRSFPMHATVRKWRALFSIWLQDGIAYRASGVIWILTDVVRSAIMPLVFIAAMEPGGTIAGFSAGQFVLYYLSLLLLLNFITSHLMWDLSYEIKEGIFTINLLRPVSYFQVCFIRNLAWRLLRLVYFAPMFAVLLFLYRGYLTDIHLYLGWEVWVAVILGHLVSFTFVYMMSMLALFFQETQSIFELYYFPMLFLSGQLFPISLLPDWAIYAAKLMPFYYTTALPVEVLIERLSPVSALPLILAQVGWIIGQSVAARYLWRFGLKHYTAVGM